MPPSRLTLTARLLQVILIVLASIPIAHAQQEQPGLFEALGKLLQPQSVPVEASEEAKPGTRAIAPQPAGQTGKRVALVIGNDAYQKVSKLEKAGNDASAMARELKAAGFDVLLHRDLNYRGMVKAVETLSNKIAGGDQVIVFFAGHGIQIKTGSYLLPIDIEASSESEVEKTAYGLADLTEKLSEAKASFTLVMVDACRDNPLKSKGRSVGATRGLSAIEPPKGQMVVYSASKGQQALDRLSDNDNNPNGVFTRSFIARMKKPGVRVEDLVREVQDAVEELAQTVSHEQRPAIYNESRGSFYFFGPTTVNVQPGSTASAAPAQARTPAEIEDSFWNSIKDDREAHGFDEYLKQYPKGSYAAQARVTLTKLKKDAAPIAPASISAQPDLPAKAEDPESQFWNEVKSSGTREYLDAYLKQYPKGKYIALARVELKKLDERDKAQRARDDAANQQAAENQRQETQRAEQGAWEEAKAGNSAAAYASYLDRYPAGRNVAQAWIKLATVKKEEAEARLVEDPQWKRVIDTAADGAAVQAYLGNHPAKLEELKTLARKGNAVAQGNLARMYINGWGVTKDYAEGRAWARKAADQGNSDGQLVLGFTLSNGFGIAKNEAEGVQWYRKAADQGNARGQLNLGAMYANGQGVAKDEAESVRWYRKAADQGLSSGQDALGFMYANGQGVAKDEAEAVRWLRKAADQGLAGGQNRLGFMYANGREVARDDAEAVRWYRKAADQGNADGQSNLGSMYADGRGVAKDEAEAVRWLRKAADQGNAYGQYNLGVMYANGQGVAIDEAEAVRWYRKAADQGHVPAKNKLLLRGL